jgi:hypothetical protein
MPACLWFLCLAAGPAAEPPAAVPLCAAEEWYRSAKAREETIEGVVERNPGTGRIGTPARFNPYRLAWTDGAGKAVVRELYAPGKGHVLAAHLGQRVRVAGKLVDTEADGKTYPELWPARLEPLTGALPATRPESGVYARCWWQPQAVLRPQAQTHVIRGGQELARHLRLTGSGPLDEAATSHLAQRLRVPGIDWKKHMLVTVGASLRGAGAERLTIDRVAVKDGVLTVSYHLEFPPGGPSGLGFPAETVLVDRFDGEVRFEETTAP